MADNKGWIKVHRKIFDCWVWKDKPFDKARAWIDLLLLAMHHDTKTISENKVIEIPRGSYMTSILKLSERWGWSKGKTKRFINELETDSMLTTTRTNTGTLVTIVNYEVYQPFDNDDRPTDGPTNEPTDRPTDGPHNNKLKNIKNINSLISNDINRQTEVRQVIEEWNTLSAYGIKSVSKISSSSKRYSMLSGRLNEYSIDDVFKAIDNIRHSDFLQGKHKGKPWQITFDWFVCPSNFPKVLEGNYCNDIPVQEHGVDSESKWQ